MNYRPHNMKFTSMYT